MKQDVSTLLGTLFDKPLSDTEAAAIRTALLKEDDPTIVGEVAALLQRFSVLVEVNKTVARSSSLDDILPQLMTVIAKVLHAERATLFLHDRQTNELFSRVIEGGDVSEIRIPDDFGLAGAVYHSGEPLNIPDAYSDPRFSPDVDKRTGYRTRNILSVPIRNRDGRVLGVTQVLNKGNGGFSAPDSTLLGAVTTQAAAALEHAQSLEELEKAHRDEVTLLEITSALAGDLDLDSLLRKIVEATTRLIAAERSTLFLHDENTGELWARVAEGIDRKEIRIPSYGGLAGTSFTTGATINIPDAYADPRFNPEFDQKTGFRTRSILCMPLLDRLSQPIGVMQVLNKIGGAFTPLDETRLKAFCAQGAIAIESARLFHDVLELKNYNEGILKSLSNGVVTLDAKLTITKVNESALRILGLNEDDLVRRPARQIFANTNKWILTSLDYVARTGGSDYHSDTDLIRNGPTISVNLTVAPLMDLEDKLMGYMLVFEDLTREKRMRITMSRYLAKEVVDKLLESGEDAFLASSQKATVLFSDIRHFATLSEVLGPGATVQMLNEYFDEMVEIVLQNGGVLDKYIGDALMAVFGAPLVGQRDADNAVLAAIDMVRALERLNARRRDRGEEALSIGIGISTGDVVAGSIGSTKRMDYTVIGDSVNLAARLEGANKFFGTSTLVSGETLAQMKAALAWREIDLIRVTGTNRLVSIFEPLEYYPPALGAALKRTRGAYQRGLSLFRRRAWTEALPHFEAVLAQCPNDRPTQLYIDRCRYYTDHPPEADWDGVWILRQK